MAKPLSECTLAWDTISSNLQALLDKFVDMDKRLSDLRGADQAEQTGVYRVIGRIRAACGLLAGLPQLCRPQQRWVDHEQYQNMAPEVVNSHFWPGVSFQPVEEWSDPLKPAAPTSRSPISYSEWLQEVSSRADASEHPAASLDEFLDTVLPSYAVQMFRVPNSDQNLWLNWEQDSEVGRQVVALVTMAVEVSKPLRDLSGNERMDYWRAIAQQCRVWANG